MNIESEIYKQGWDERGKGDESDLYILQSTAIRLAKEYAKAMCKNQRAICAAEIRSLIVPDSDFIIDHQAHSKALNAPLATEEE